MSSFGVPVQLKEGRRPSIGLPAGTWIRETLHGWLRNLRISALIMRRLPEKKRSSLAAKGVQISVIKRSPQAHHPRIMHAARMPALSLFEYWKRVEDLLLVGRPQRAEALALHADSWAWLGTEWARISRDMRFPRGKGQVVSSGRTLK